MYINKISEENDFGNETQKLEISIVEINRTAQKEISKKFKKFCKDLQIKYYKE